MNLLDYPPTCKVGVNDDVAFINAEKKPSSAKPGSINLNAIPEMPMFGIKVNIHRDSDFELCCPD